jgi:dynein heavy chain
MEDSTHILSCDVIHACAGEGERVSLALLNKNPIKARGNVEAWLGSVESTMMSSLRRLAKQGMATYPEEPRTEWVLQQPAQLVIAVSQVYWCAAVEEQLRGHTPQHGLSSFHQVRIFMTSLLPVAAM